MKFINGTKLDERLIRTDIDPGFKAGRQFGRGKSGGQVRDEFREDYDEGRGGWGARIQEEEAREEKQRDVYESFSQIPEGSHTDLYTKSYRSSKRERDEDDLVESAGYSKRSNPRFRDRSPSPGDE